MRDVLSKNSHSRLWISITSYRPEAGLFQVVHGLAAPPGPKRAALKQHRHGRSAFSRPEVRRPGVVHERTAPHALNRHSHCGVATE